MEKDNEHVDLIMSRIIKEIVKAKEETEKEAENGMDEEVRSKMMIEENRVKELQKNAEFFKATLNMADALVKTIELAKREGREIGYVSMSEILTGILVVLEEGGFVKIIENGEEN